MADDPDRLALLRWRLVLGKFSERHLGAPGGSDAPMSSAGPGGSPSYDRMDRALDFLYGREYGKRGVRDRGRHSDDRTGTPGASVLAIPDWLKDVRELFPRETVEVLERHALERYGMTELVTDADVLKKMEPSYELLKAVLSFRHLMAPEGAGRGADAGPASGRRPQEAAGARGSPGPLGPGQPAAAQPAEGRAQPRLASHDPVQSQALRPRAASG